MAWPIIRREPPLTGILGCDVRQVNEAAWACAKAGAALLCPRLHSLASHLRAFRLFLPSCRLASLISRSLLRGHLRWLFPYSRHPCAMQSGRAGLQPSRKIESKDNFLSRSLLARVFSLHGPRATSHRSLRALPCFFAANPGFLSHRLTSCFPRSLQTLASLPLSVLPLADVKRATHLASELPPALGVVVSHFTIPKMERSRWRPSFA